MPSPVIFILRKERETRREEKRKRESSRLEKGIERKEKPSRLQRGGESWGIWPGFQTTQASSQGVPILS